MKVRYIGTAPLDIEATVEGEHICYPVIPGSIYDLTPKQATALAQTVPASDIQSLPEPVAVKKATHARAIESAPSDAPVAEPEKSKPRNR